MAVYVDTDHAGGLRIRRATSGWGYIPGTTLHQGMAQHTKRRQRYHQERPSFVEWRKGGARGLGCRSRLEDRGDEGKHRGDRCSDRLRCSTRHRMSTRLGKQLSMRRPASLGRQDKITSGDIKVATCKGIERPADMLTKHSDSKGTASHMEMCAADTAGSRHRLAPEA